MQERLCSRQCSPKPHEAPTFVRLERANYSSVVVTAFVSLLSRANSYYVLLYYEKLKLMYATKN